MKTCFPFLLLCSQIFAIKISWRTNSIEEMFGSQVSFIIQFDILMKMCGAV